MTVRSIKDLNSPALSYAEVKAIASGNPLVLEKAQVDADVMRLSILKSQHEDSQFRIRLEIKAIQRRTPRLEEHVGKMIANTSKRIDTKGDRFIIELEGHTYTERKPAGKRILTLVEKHQTKDEVIKIGKLGSFTIETLPGNTNEITLRGNLKYTSNISASPLGTISSLENIFPSIDKHLKELRDELHEDHTRLEGLQTITGQKFEYSDQLAELLAKQKELTEKLTVEEEPQVIESTSSNPIQNRSPESLVRSV